MLLRHNRGEDTVKTTERTEALQQALDSFHVLFEQISSDGRSRRIVSERFKSFLEGVYSFLRLEKEPENREDHPDGIDALNAMGICCGKKSLSTLLDEALFEALLRLNAADLKSPGILKEAENNTGTLHWTLCHAMQFAAALETVLKSSPLMTSWKVPSSPEKLSRLTPASANMNLRTSRFLRSTLKGLVMELLNEHAKNDLFAAHRTFRYRKGKFLPVELHHAGTGKDFFGYREAKELFREHFTGFAEGRHNIPLLLSGLPGLGKTCMTIAYALELTDAVLILPDPEALQEDLEQLIGVLAENTAHKFILFFDDVDTEKINFYYFRTHVGGSFVLPGHIMTVIASNYRFPPNVASRGRTFSFPLFDEIRCQEMIEDFLLQKGMKNVSNDLLSVVASDYVESYGQKIYDELSPRSLSRYLNLYLQNREKRTRMLDFSRGEVITRPDPEAFYAQNLKLLRALYGKEILEEIREQELSGKV